jgi:uncharacterized protein YqgC (DUF456 family)
MDGLTVVVGLMILVGFVGIAIPVLPGLLVVWGAVLLWASVIQAPAGWLVLGIATTLALAGFLLQYLLPGRRMRHAGVTTSTMLAGVALAVVGFFLVPVVGVFLGFALGIYLTERIKQGAHPAAWQSTTQALKAIGLSMGIELLTALAIAVTWVIGVVATT